MSAKRDFVINELMNTDFVEKEDNLICLEEKEDTGRSFLEIHLMANEILSIKNVDSKNTQLHFFKSNRKLSMYKRVDHIIFERLTEKQWKLHLIEMKSSVGYDKWLEIKGKFRASYLLAQGIAAMLEINIVDTCMYTSFEKVQLDKSDTMPAERRLPLGERHTRPQDEWKGRDFTLNFGDRIKFLHIPIQMARDTNNVLVGQMTM